MSNSTQNNQYAMLADIDDDDITIAASNKTKNKELANKATSPIQICKDMGIADAGATGHFLQPGAPAKNIKIASKPISISQPDVKELISTHECEIDNPDLPKAARKAHIVPGLAHTSLVSIKMLIDAGCFVTYGQNVIVYHNKRVVWKGSREKITGLWVLPLKPKMKITTYKGRRSNRTVPPTRSTGKEH